MNPMWMILASIAAVLVLAAAFVVQQHFARKRRAAAPMPPLCTSDEHVTTPTAHPAAVQVLSRDALVNPNRTLNVHGWDDTPDEGVDFDLSGVEDDPRVIDRSFLSNRSRPGAQG